MPMTTITNESSKASGTSTNRTQGDKYTKQMLGLYQAAGGLNLTKAKKQAQYEQQVAALQYKLDQGKMTQEQFAAKQAQLEQKLAQPGKGKEAMYEIALEGMKPVEMYPEKTYVEQDPYTLESIAARAEQARTGGGGMTDLAKGYVSDVLGGKYLGEQNPYLKGMYESAAGGVTSDYLNTVLPQLEARFARSGGQGGAYQAAIDRANAGLSDTLSGMASNLYGTAYMQERDLMSGAAGMAPTMQQMGYYDIDELERSGRTKEEFERIKLQELMDRFYQTQDKDFTALNRITGAAQQLPMAAGGGTTDWTARNVGTSTTAAPTPPSGKPPMWATILSSLFGGGGGISVGKSS